MYRKVRKTVGKRSENLLIIALELVKLLSKEIGDLSGSLLSELIIRYGSHCPPNAFWGIEENLV